LLKAQFNIFIASGNFKFILLSAIAFFAKSMIDAGSFLAGYNGLFFNRMGDAVPTDVEALAKKLILQEFQ
jgi:hypothetical protein